MMNALATEIDALLVKTPLQKRKHSAPRIGAGMRGAFRRAAGRVSFAGDGVESEVAAGGTVGHADEVAGVFVGQVCVLVGVVVLTQATHGDLGEFCGRPDLVVPAGDEEDGAVWLDVDGRCQLRLRRGRRFRKRSGHRCLRFNDR